LRALSMTRPTRRMTPEGGYGELLIKPLQATGQIIDFADEAFVRAV